MFTILIGVTAVIIAVAMWYVYAVTRDVFHPLIIIGPMMVFMYAWMPMKLDSIGALDGFFQRDQLEFVQFVNILGVVCFILGCLSVGCRLPAVLTPLRQVPPSRLLIGGILLGSLGLAAWMIALKNIGGITALADSLTTSFNGGWDESGYVRDGPLLLFPAVLLILAVLCQQGFRILLVCLLTLFLTPWVIQSIFASKRGPAFMVVVIVALGWFLNRRTRPPLLVTAAAGLLLGLLMLFLVTNRGKILLSGDLEVTTDVTAIVERPDAGNEYIYGAGGIISADQRRSFYWGRRYLAEVIVRPIPSSIWPNKYEDFGLPELTHNAGTGEGFKEILGWEGANGSAPGIVADLWLEFWWLNLPALFLLGWCYGFVWRKANLEGGRWVAQYAIMSALSIYLVMQTMEAVLFRLVLLSVPMQLSWSGGRPSQPPVRLPSFDDAGSESLARW